MKLTKQNLKYALNESWDYPSFYESPEHGLVLANCHINVIIFTKDPNVFNTLADMKYDFYEID
jgi:hypothetical protein